MTETVYKDKIRPYGKTDGSLTDVHLPTSLAEELRLWKQGNARTSAARVAPGAFIFPNTRGGFLDTANYRNRVLNPLAERLDLPRLNFQVSGARCNTSARHAIGEGHSGASAARESDTTADEYMQELLESVKKIVGSVYVMLGKGGDLQRALRICHHKLLSHPKQLL